MVKNINRFTGELPEGYTKAYKEEIQKAILENNAGKCRAFSNEFYGEIIIISTVIAGNLVLQNGFYPIAFVRPETSKAILNTQDTKHKTQFKKVQNLIRETCKVIQKCSNATDLIEYVNENQNFGLE